MSVGGKKALCISGGAGSLTWIEAARRLGCHVTVIDWQPDSSGALVADRTLVADVRKHESLSLLEADGVAYDVLLAPVGDFVLPLACKMASLLELDRQPYGTLDKIDQQERWELIGLDAPRIAVGRQVGPFPFIVKPAGLSGSQWVELCYSDSGFTQWKENYGAFLSAGDWSDYLSPPGRWLTQEYVAGVVYAVCTFGGWYSHVLETDYTPIDRQSGIAPSGAPRGPALYAARTVRSVLLEAVGRKVSRACSHRASWPIGNTDVIVDADGQYHVIESNRRLGAYDLEIAAFQSGIDLAAAVVQWSLHGDVDWGSFPVRLRKNAPRREVYLTEHDEGTLFPVQVLLGQQAVLPGIWKERSMYYVLRYVDAPPLHTVI